MKTVLASIQEVKPKSGHGFEANFFPRELARWQEVYRRLLDENEQVLQAQDLGIVEVTIKTRTGEMVAVGVSEADGLEIASVLWESLADRLSRAETRLLEIHEQLVTETECPNRIALQQLLLTPVDAQGYPVLATPTSAAA